MNITPSIALIKTVSATLEYIQQTVPSTEIAVATKFVTVAETQLAVAKYCDRVQVRVSSLRCSLKLLISERIDIFPFRARLPGGPSQL